MSAKLVVFANNRERAQMMAAYSNSNCGNEKIFGKETEKFLNYCDELCNAAISLKKENIPRLLNKIYGIAKTHRVYITWYGMSKHAPEPDRFLISGRGHERLAMIQC